MSIRSRTVDLGAILTVNVNNAVCQSITLGGFDPFHNGTDFLTVGGNESDLTQTAVIGATALFSPKLVGEFRSSYSRFRNNRIPKTDGFDLTSIGFPASLAALQQFRAFPLMGFTTVAGLGKLTTSEIRRIANSWNQSGSLTVIRSAHVLNVSWRKFRRGFNVLPGPRVSAQSHWCVDGRLRLAVGGRAH